MSVRTLAGVQPVREAIRAHGKAVTWVCLQRGTTRLAGLEALARDQGIAVRWVDRNELDRLAKGQYHQGAVAEAPALTLLRLDHVLRQPPQLLLALDGVQDPQNFGATVRSAVGLGPAAVVWGENASAPLTAAMSRASAGAVEHARLCRVPSLPSALVEATSEGYQVIGLDSHAPLALVQVDLTVPTILVVGGEGRGLSRQTRRACSHLARLVGPHSIDSLNASVAAALALYEAQRQRGLVTQDVAIPSMDATPDAAEL